MAADKKIMAEIETLRLDRPGRTHDMAATGDTLGRCLTEALRELAATYREEAELWAKSGAKGWKGSEAEKYLVAQHIDDVAAQLDNAGGGAALSVTEMAGAGLTADDMEAELRESAKRVDALQRTGASGLDALIADSVRERRGHVRDEFLDPGSPARSDAGTQPERKTAHQWNADPRVDPYVISWSDFGSSAHRLGMTFSKDDPITLAEFERARDGGAVTVASRIGEQQADGTLLIDGEDVSAYLSGEVDTLPGLAAALVPSSVTDATGIDKFALEIMSTPEVIDAETRAKLDSLQDFSATMTINGPAVDGVVPVTWESETMTADGHLLPGVAAQLAGTLPMAPARTAPLLGQPGDAGSGYSHTYVPAGGRVLRFDELLTPVPAAALPPHLSHSQIGDVGDCGVQYRLQRVDKLPQVPQWANIGGSTFHAFAEEWERAAAGCPPEEIAAAAAAVDCEARWRFHFENQIRIVAASSPVPISVWRASRKGAEGRQWWEVNGPLMLRRYLDARPTEGTLEAAVGTSPVTFIEADLTIDVPTPYGPLPFNAKIDRVTFSEDGRTITIRDYKTSYERPTDTTQLGDYSWVLRTAVGGLAPVKILGTYFDARRGEWTEPVDLLQEHPFEAFRYRVTAAHGQKRALTVGPTPARPSSYCGGCSVRYACPVMNQLAAVAPPPPAPVTP